MFSTPRPRPLPRETALRIIRAMEANPPAFACLVLHRQKDPRWGELQRAYAALAGHWVSFGE